MKSTSTRLAISALAALAMTLPQPIIAQDIDFGDDDGMWANDGECDDSRFTGPGMTSTPLLDSDIGHDATDCRTAYEKGDLTLRSDTPVQTSDGIVWGNDASQWANDGECDDKRFVGAGMTSTPLLESDIGKDASDCRAAYERGDITLRSEAPVQTSDGIVWGDDQSQWANDGECDDMRFTGVGMTSTPLLEEDIKHDATDCRTAYEQGRLELRQTGNVA